jgi:hypothetical protein
MSLLLATAYKAHDHYTRSQGYSAQSSVPQDLQTRMDAIQVKLSHLSSACMCKRAYR